MKKLILIIGFALLTMTMQYCGTRSYATPQFYKNAMHHRTIAVLPYEMVLTGKQPKKLTRKQVYQIEEIESQAFQESFYHMLYNQSNRRRHPVRIRIQPVRDTNFILKENGIDIRSSWYMSPRRLAYILGVDAIVRTRIEKRRFMSGLASLGIEIGSSILNEILEDLPIAFFVRAPTSAIKAECSIYDGRDGSTLWNITLVDDTDWRLPANEIIHHINQYFARNFPYR